MAHPTSSVPCVATGDKFLYAQKNSVACCHEQTLALERYFTQHKEAVCLLAADPDGQLVVSCDRTTAIVWDPVTGEEKRRLDLPEPLSTAVWAQRRTVAFGSDGGNVVLFDTETGDCDVCELLIDKKITALAPARTGDRWVFAVGYDNGSLLVYRLRPKTKPKPQFDWLHNLTASCQSPSPIQGLCWHSSSPLLAVHDADGGLRIWNVGDDATERIVTERRERGLGWMGWSKNGRIAHYRNGEITVWDVQNKTLKSNHIAAPDDVVGMGISGPRALCFILTTDNMVQKYELGTLSSVPPSVIAEKKHPLVSTTLPVSIEDKNVATTFHTAQPSRLSLRSVNSEESLRSVNSEESEITIMKGWWSDDEKSNNEELNNDETSRSYAFPYPSGLPRANTTATRPSSQETSFSTSTWTSAGSSPSAKVPNSFLPGMHDLLSTLSIEEPQRDDVADLFPNTRRRMTRTRFPRGPIRTATTLREFQAQVLAIVFGWQNSVEDLVRYEIAHAAQDEPRFKMLAKWLSHTAPVVGIDRIRHIEQCAEAYAQNGNVHAAVSILLQVRLYDKAVGLYEKRGQHMEAVIAAFLYVPSWKYQADLLAAWARAEEQRSPPLTSRW